MTREQQEIANKRRSGWKDITELGMPTQVETEDWVCDLWCGLCSQIPLSKCPKGCPCIAIQPADFGKANQPVESKDSLHVWNGSPRSQHVSWGNLHWTVLLKSAVKRSDKLFEVRNQTDTELSKSWKMILFYLVSTRYCILSCTVEIRILCKQDNIKKTYIESHKLSKKWSNHHAESTT